MGCRRTLLMFVVVVIPMATGVAAAEGAQAERIRIGFVAQPAGIRDPYIRIAYAGVQRAVRELRVQARVLTPGPREGSVPSYTYFARRNYDLVIGQGFLEAASVDAVAVRFPRTKFAISGVPWEALPHRPRNVRGLDFKVEEAGYLAGYLAALVERRRPGRDVISSVGGVKLPSVDRFIAGYEAGARRASPTVETVHAYADDFLDEAKCRAVAERQIAAGSGVVFAVAGGCGLGALLAARRAGVFGVGVDIDQSSLGPHILTSAVKREDVAVFRTIRAVVQRQFSGGRTATYGLRDGGVALGKISPRVPRALRVRVERIRRQIVAGQIRGIPKTVN